MSSTDTNTREDDVFVDLSQIPEECDGSSDISHDSHCNCENDVTYLQCEEEHDCTDSNCDDDEYSSDETYESDEEDLDDDENACILRGKWIYDGSKTIDEMVQSLEREIVLLRDLERDGWKVLDVVDDDYARLVRDEQQTD